jgi:hypothetical protein
MKTHRTTDVKADFEGREGRTSHAMGESAGCYCCGRIWVDPFDDFRHISHLASPSQQDQFHASGGVFTYPEQHLTKRQSIRRERAGE